MTAEAGVNERFTPASWAGDFTAVAATLVVGRSLIPISGAPPRSSAASASTRLAKSRGSPAASGPREAPATNIARPHRPSAPARVEPPRAPASAITEGHDRGDAGDEDHAGDDEGPRSRDGDGQRGEARRSKHEAGYRDPYGAETPHEPTGERRQRYGGEPGRAYEQHVRLVESEM